MLNVEMQTYTYIGSTIVQIYYTILADIVRHIYTAILLGSSMHQRRRSAVLFGSGVGIESIYTSCHLFDPSWSRTGS